MKSQSEMISKLNNLLRVNFPKVGVSLFLLIILCSASLTICVIPAIFYGSSGMVIGVFVWGVFSFVVIFGFCVIAYRFASEQRVVIGHLFDGFRFASRIFPAGFFFIAFLGICFFIVAVLLFIIATVIPNFISSLNFTLFFFIMLSLYAIIFFVVLIVFSFYPFYLYTQPTEKSFFAMFKSTKILKGKRFHYITYLLKAGGFFLLAAIIAYIVTIIIQYQVGSFASFQELATVLTADTIDQVAVETALQTASSVEVSSGVDLLLSLLEFVYFIGGCISIIRVVLASAIYYVELYPVAKQESEVLAISNDDDINKIDDVKSE